MKKSIYGLATGLALVVATGCTQLQPEPQPLPTQAAEVEENSTPTKAVGQNSGNSQTTRPATKAATISVEGESTPVTLSLFSQEGYPFTTYVPERFEPETVAADEGRAVRFYWTKPDGTRDESAYVHFFFPNQEMTVEQMEESIVEESGLLATNQWELVSRTEADSLPWAVEQINFRQASSPQNILGNVFIGQANDEVFRVTVQYPAEYGDGLAPRVAEILENVEVK